MDHFLAVSFSREQSEPATVAEWIARGRAALEAIAGSSVQEIDAGSAGRLLLADPHQRLCRDDAGNWCHILAPAAFTQDSGHRLQAEDLLALALDAQSGDEFAAQLAPPFGAVLRCATENSEGNAIQVLCDSRGLQHLYYFESDGVAMLSSSSLVLGRTTKQGLDLSALGTFALVGNYLGHSTPFAAVRKMGAGQLARLADGRIEFASIKANPRDSESLNGADAIEAGRVIVAARVESCLAAADNVAIELSGGLDSRLMLAAIPPDRRRGLVGLTLGFPGSEDLKVATRLAAANGMTHRIVDLRELSQLSTEEACAVARRSAQACDYSSNPFSRGVLDWVDARIDCLTRLTGQNGEFARGFYYPGQSDGEVTRARAKALANWRIAVNESVDVSQLDKGFHGRAKEACIAQIEEEMLAGASSWLAATDEFYLSNRMGRGAGTSYSKAQRERLILAPFFHDDFTDWARRLPASMKHGGRVLAELVRALDPKLSRQPLDSGRSPDTMLKGGVTAKFQRGLTFGRKVVKKIRQRLLRSDKIAVGAADLTQKVLAQFATVEEMAPRATALGIVAESCRGLPPSALASNTAGFFLNVEWTLEAID